jgi:hypothetical protein
VTSKSDKPAPGSEPVVRPDQRKRRYEKPRLIDYGPVNKLTQTGGISVTDNRTMFRPCL